MPKERSVPQKIARGTEQRRRRGKQHGVDSAGSSQQFPRSKERCKSHGAAQAAAFDATPHGRGDGWITLTFRLFLQGACPSTAACILLVFSRSVTESVLPIFGCDVLLQRAQETSGDPPSKSRRRSTSDVNGQSAAARPAPMRGSLTRQKSLQIRTCRLSYRTGFAPADLNVCLCIAGSTAPTAKGRGSQ
jgi:hypothetical protein